ncbi:N-acetylmuramoyl-L-alanine amidase [Tumebacillus sp. ITR2]|uniref:N-acetylmuramoyl-L-alanine amidase n=1 Tax=Tumebacillus amylolyticus TaxID=2801339 RepID=A0ABS1J811_9BACL|nr:N-acetylmuramoyl-L-alanine amidase [Tumebacillus amylolyticus]MBL0386384.1 N-acetylmuramoyl-L-alanine amidase [Tumebacillus amylolyticus]
MSKLICLDPGHGGYDPGAAANGTREKDITLHIARQLRDLLIQTGFEVVMTRETDTSPGGKTEVNADLNERCRIANAAGADVFLSIHVNAGGGHGAELYTNGDGGPIAPLAKNIVKNVSAICGFHGQAVRDGGSNGTGFCVIVGTKMDAMLLEIGFIDTDDLPKIQANLEEFAPLIARAFWDFYGVPLPTAGKSSLEKTSAEEALVHISAFYNYARLEDQIALNRAANAIRAGAGLAITTDLGKPCQEAARRVETLLQATWPLTDDQNLQACYSAGAQKMREDQK